jgi:hypothetical protein
MWIVLYADGSFFLGYLLPAFRVLLGGFFFFLPFFLRLVKVRPASDGEDLC